MKTHILKRLLAGLLGGAPIVAMGCGTPDDAANDSADVGSDNEAKGGGAAAEVAAGGGKAAGGGGAANGGGGKAGGGAAGAVEVVRGATAG
jgi:hypothetical protein